MIRYIHGSEDSIDIDTHYVFDKLPDFKYCQEFCSNKEENRNIIVINEGVVIECFKGTIDEINNGLYYTYNLHKQEYPLLITRTLPRDILLKDVRVLRGILSYLSRTEYRTIIKEALRSGWNRKIEVVKSIDWDMVCEFNKNYNKEDVYKVYAFQLGQSLGLHEGYEFYTKKDISNKYPKLEKYLYREKNIDFRDLLKYINIFIDVVDKYKTIENGLIVEFCGFEKVLDFKTEKYVG